jgi:hypothetical protein
VDDRSHNGEVDKLSYNPHASKLFHKSDKDELDILWLDTKWPIPNLQQEELELRIDAKLAL